jgi:hypothetical protein
MEGQWRERQWIRASEIGEYLYCQRAWWYRLQDAASANVRELARGTQYHAQHGRWLRWAALLRWLAIVLIAVALLLLFTRVLNG